MFKLDGSDGCYLFVKPNENNWSVWSGLNGEKRYIRSVSCGHPCPAHKSNSKKERYNQTAWLVNKSKDKGGNDWKETTTEILVSCETHGCNNQN